MTKAVSVEKMRAEAERASSLMKVLGHPGRLMVLCHLSEGEMSVGEIAESLQMSQSALSQHLARMRAEGLVETRRESQTVFYRLADGDVRRVIENIYEIYCPID